jgi:hypothetical protein
MDQLSIPILIFASFPEAVIVALLGIYSIGKFSFLKDRQNILRILIMSVISVVSSYFVRQMATSEIENLLISIIIFYLLFTLVARLKFYESVFATLFGFVIFIVTEIICLVLVSAITGIKLDQAYLSDFIRIAITLPERLLQIGLIVFAVIKSIRIIDLETVTINKKEYYVQIIVYILSMGTLVFLAIIMAKMTLFSNDVHDTTNTVLIRMNIYLSLFVTIVLTLAVRSTHEYYRNKNTLNNNEFVQSLQYISNLIDNKDYRNAKIAVENLKSHIETGNG